MVYKIGIPITCRLKKKNVQNLMANVVKQLHYLGNFIISFRLYIVIHSPRGIDNIYVNTRIAADHFYTCTM